MVPPLFSDSSALCLLAANPNWALASIALAGMAVGLALLVWSARRTARQSLGAGCGLLVGSVVTLVSILTLIASMGFWGSVFGG